MNPSLKELAEAATRGEWVAEPLPSWWSIGPERAASPDPIHGHPRVGDIVATIEGGRGEGYREEFIARQAANAAYIAAASPDVVISWIDRALAAEARAARAEEALREIVAVTHLSRGWEARRVNGLALAVLPALSEKA